jgi:hypothetical protein
MNALEILQGGLVTIRKPGQHCKGALARMGQGRKTKPTSPYARSWDSTGAAMKAAAVDVIAHDQLEDALELLRLAASEQGCISPRQLDDTLGQFAAVEMYRRALEIATSPPARANTEGSTT